MNESLNELQRLVVEAAAEKQAINILVLDLRMRSELTDCFIICSGASKVQVRAIVDFILEKAGPLKPAAMEGYSEGNWVIVDLQDLMVHVFQKDVRAHYDLERLWGDVPALDVPAQI